MLWEALYHQCYFMFLGVLLMIHDTSVFDKGIKSLKFQGKRCCMIENDRKNPLSRLSVTIINLSYIKTASAPIVNRD